MTRVDSERLGRPLSLEAATTDAQPFGGTMADSLSLTETWVNDVVVVEVSGDVDMASAPEVRHAIDRTAREKPAALIVSLRGTTFLSLAGVNVLLAEQRKMLSSSRFGVVADGPVTYRPLKLLGIDGVVALYRTVDEAMVDLA